MDEAQIRILVNRTDLWLCRNADSVLLLAVGMLIIALLLYIFGGDI